VAVVGRYRPEALEARLPDLVARLDELIRAKPAGPAAASSGAGALVTTVSLPEAGIRALEHLCAGVFPHPQQELMQACLLHSSEKKSLELNSAAGRALALLCAGPASLEGCDPLLPRKQEDAAQRALPEAEASCNRLLDRVLGEWCGSVKAAHRHAAGVWLTSLVQLNGHFPALQPQLARVQTAFIELLAEGNDIHQSIAASGLSLCYDKGTPATKAQLVELLVGTLSQGQRSKASLGCPPVAAQQEHRRLH
jgi:hypothetical protein